jgi:hypothetical protein
MRGARRPGLLVTRTIVADALLPAFVLISVPLAIGATGSASSGDILGGWRFVLWTLPDLGVALLVLSAVPLGLGAWKLATWARTRVRSA